MANVLSASRQQLLAKLLCYCESLTGSSWPQFQHPAPAAYDCMWLLFVDMSQLAWNPMLCVCEPNFTQQDLFFTVLQCYESCCCCCCFCCCCCRPKFEFLWLLWPLDESACSFVSSNRLKGHFINTGCVATSPKVHVCMELHFHYNRWLSVNNVLVELSWIRHLTHSSADRIFSIKGGLQIFVHAKLFTT